MNRITDVVKHLLAINVLVYLAATYFLGDSSVHILGLFFPTSEFFRGHQLVSHMFMHAGIGHLFFNMLMLFFLGPYVERALGPKKFLLFYLVSGFGAMIAHFGMMVALNSVGLNIPVVGASGALYGVLIAFAYMYPDVKLMLLFPPIPIKAKFLVLILIALDLFGGFGAYNLGIAHFAHLGGALFGFLLMYYWKQKK